MNVVHVRDQKHELTPPRNSLKTRRANYLAGPDPLSLPSHPLCHPTKADYRSTSIYEVEALTVDSDAITI
ncbi:hypothetical protein GQ457_16G017100 [Hibiscus cannabinus]